MVRLRVWSLSAVLVAGGGAVTAAEPPARPLEQTTLMNKLFGPKKPKPAAPAAPVTITAPLAPEVKADALRAEQDAYLRRVSICTELRRVALERGDDALARQADELERQAASLYNARVAGLGVSRVKSPLPETSPYVSTEGGPTDAQIAKAKAQRLMAPSVPVPGATAQVREVAP